MNAPMSPTQTGNWVWNGTMWVCNPCGCGGPPPCPQQSTTTLVFAISVPSALTITTNVWEQVPFNVNPTIDLLSGWNPSSYKYMPNVAGAYNFSLMFNMPGTFIGFLLLKNDSGAPTGTSDTVVAANLLEAAGGPSVSSFMSASGICYLNGTTDYVRCFAIDSDGAVQGYGSSPVFQAWLLP